MDLFGEEVAAVLEILEGVVAGSSWRKEHYPTLRRVLGAPGDNFSIVVLDKSGP